MQTMTPTWPPPATNPPQEWAPPAPAKKNSKGWIVLGVFVAFLSLAAIGAASGGSTNGTGTTSSRYTYSNGDYPNGWTESQVSDAASGLAQSGVSVATGGCLLRYAVDHYTPSEMMAADPTSIARSANC